MTINHLLLHKGKDIFVLIRTVGSIFDVILVIDIDKNNADRQVV